MNKMKSLFCKSGFCKLFITIFINFCIIGSIAAQNNFIVNLAPIDGIDLTPDNIFNFQVQSFSSHTTDVTVKGILRYRNTDMMISYSFPYSIKPGINIINKDLVHAQWQFSNGLMKQLFFTYKFLPTGTFQYCVNLQVNNSQNGDAGATSNIQEDCIYHRRQDLFLINLITPENNAKIHEDNPALTWVVNYPFASQLTYRIKVAPILKGQNAENAITRNNYVYDARNLIQNNIVYPIYAKPLQHNQPYAWTVDAYYGNILLGSAEKWKFTIVDDTPYTAVSVNMSYIDIKREQAKTNQYAVGQIKLKYVLEDYRYDTLDLHIYNSNNKEVSLKGNRLPAIYGDNRYEINLRDSCQLKHTGEYDLIINSRYGETYRLKFEYINPIYNH